MCETLQFLTASAAARREDWGCWDFTSTRRTWASSTRPWRAWPSTAKVPVMRTRWNTCAQNIFIEAHNSKVLFIRILHLPTDSTNVRPSVCMWNVYILRMVYLIGFTLGIYFVKCQRNDSANFYAIWKPDTFNTNKNLSWQQQSYNHFVFGNLSSK